MKKFSVSFFLLFTVGCAMVDPTIYDASRKAQIEHLKERIADSKAYVSQRDVEQVYLDRIKTVAADEVANVTDAQDLQAKLNSLRSGWPDDGYGHQTGQRRRMVRLYVTNQTQNYVVRFAESPFDVIGELGPGETSDSPITVREGSLTLHYFETELGREAYFGGRERNIPIFIQAGRTKPITIKNQ
jgi:hypothetical protein